MKIQTVFYTLIVYKYVSIYFLLAEAKNFTELAELQGLTCHEHDVITDDGYILKLFHIPGNKGMPVLLMHGIVDSADTWLMNGEISLANVLNRAGYDVWAGNCRGNRYARRHISSDPDVDDKFWDFSFHEHAYYDLSATIDAVLTKTGESKLNGIGHSQGNELFYILGASRPEYNIKVNLVTALAPVSFQHNMLSPAAIILKQVPKFKRMFKSFRGGELFGANSLMYNFLKFTCRSAITYDICARGVLFLIFGDDEEGLSAKSMPEIFSHIPQSTSLKNIFHYAQVALNKRLAFYDYGVKSNIAVYNSTRPPLYDLSKVNMKVAFIAGRNDLVSSPKDVAILRRKLPNIVFDMMIENPKYNHIDFTWGEHNDIYLLPHIFRILKLFGA